MNNKENFHLETLHWSFFELFFLFSFTTFYGILYELKKTKL